MLPKVETGRQGALAHHAWSLRIDLHIGQNLNEAILVPFPVESCLSGLRNHTNELNVPPTYLHMFYRTELNGTRLRLSAAGGSNSRFLLHFGAVDWHVAGRASLKSWQRAIALHYH